MKRLAIFLVLGLLALNLVRHKSADRHGRHRDDDRHRGNYRVVVSLGSDCDDEGCTDPACHHPARTIVVSRGGEHRAAVMVGPAAAVSPVAVAVGDAPEPPAPPAPPEPPRLREIGREVREGFEEGFRGFDEGFAEGMKGLEDGLENAGDRLAETADRLARRAEQATHAQARRAEQAAHAEVSRAHARVVAETARAKARTRAVKARTTEATAFRTFEGRVSATEDRAKADARARLREAVATWLEPDVPAGWGRLDREAERLVDETRVRPEAWDFGLPDKATMYRATVRADLSDRRRAEIVEKYRREVVAARLVGLGGGLGFALVCLGALAGYIRADEATRGYYTNRLRLLAAAGVGGAGVAIYKMLA